MKINLIIVLSLLMLSGCSSYMATYEQTPITINGSSSDWTTTLDSKDHNSFSYGISNDSENLYLRINVNDQLIQRKLMLAGLSVWIDTTGKKKGNVGITCPIEKVITNTSRNALRKSKSKPEWNNNQLLEARFIGFEKSEEIYFLYSNPYEVEVSIDLDEFKSLYYEMKIPFKSIYSDYSDLSLKKLSIGLETGVLKMPSPSINRGGMSTPNRISGSGKGGGRQGGMSGAGGRQGGQHSGGSPNNSLTNLSTPTKVWIKNIKLATN